MSNLLLTIIAAVILMGLVFLGFAIGWFITGKVKLHRGCGLRPKDDKKTSPCSICGADKICEEEENESTR